MRPEQESFFEALYKENFPLLWRKAAAVLHNSDLAAEVDNATIEYTGTDNPVDPQKLRVKDAGLAPAKMNSLDAWRLQLFDYLDDDAFLQEIGLGS